MAKMPKTPSEIASDAAVAHTDLNVFAGVVELLEAAIASANVERK